MQSNVDLNKLMKEQISLAEKVVINNKLGKISLIAGCDIISNGPDDLICCIAILEYPSLKLIEKNVTSMRAVFPYIQNFEAFREGPIIVNTYAELSQKPDVLMVKGLGIAHPRRIGIASQIGLQLNVPTIGIAQKTAIGKFSEDKLILKGEIVGVTMHTKEHANPVIVSPGHMISVAKALELAKETIINPHKLPEPLFLAHKFANKEKKIAASEHKGQVSPQPESV
jgi:deoxyribonuclease V